MRLFSKRVDFFLKENYNVWPILIACAMQSITSQNAFLPWTKKEAGQNLIYEVTAARSQQFNNSVLDWFPLLQIELCVASITHKRESLCVKCASSSAYDFLKAALDQRVYRVFLQFNKDCQRMSIACVIVHAGKVFVLKRILSKCVRSYFTCEEMLCNRHA
jgi:hypothetical protein